MSRLLLSFAPALALALLVGTAPTAARAQDRPQHPRLRAALQELREARAELVSAKDTWPPGNKERALAAIDDAIKSLRTILEVKNDEEFRNFRGVDRDQDYYKRYPDHPRLRSALQDLREAREELRAAKADFGNLKERALDDIDVAIGHITALIRR